MKQLSLREKAILAGLYLSKFDSEGLRRLGFDNFIEAFNVIGSALGVRPASVKNYRDEFDPLFPNKRMGWHKRPVRDYCKAIYSAFGNLSLEKFTELLKQIIYKEHDLDVLIEEVERKEGEDSLRFNQKIECGVPVNGIPPGEPCRRCFPVQGSRGAALHYPPVVTKVIFVQGQVPSSIRIRAPSSDAITSRLASMMLRSFSGLNQQRNLGLR